MTTTDRYAGAMPRDKRLSVPRPRRTSVTSPPCAAPRDTLRALPGSPGAGASEARLVRAVFEAGLERARELQDYAGYEALAADGDYRAYHDARRAASPRTSRG